MDLKKHADAKRVRKAGTLHARQAALAATIASALLAACGGGGSSAPAGTSSSGANSAGSLSTGTTTTSSTSGTDATASVQVVKAAATTTHADAFRLLTQATFGPTDADIAHAMAIGASAWVDEQLAKPVRATHLQRWNADNAALATQGGALSQNVDASFMQEALTYDDQLRQRMTFALSELFVVSTQNLRVGGGQKSQTAASYLDMLANGAFGNYRDLLQAVTLHPAMGQYLSSLGNMKEDPKSGRIPDQNFAREILQLFSIGLVQLNLDGTPKLDANGQPIPTYGAADIDGLSRVFTGFGWSGPDTLSPRFFSQPGYMDPGRLYTAMQSYPQYHSLSEKKFLGQDIAATTTSDGMGELKVALDTIFNHPNVGPFVAKQLIQRLVTSNPSPAYVSRVAAVFNNNGAGVRGDLKAVTRAILLDNEARSPSMAALNTYGKLREPVLRLTAALRAYSPTSDSGLYLIGLTDDPGTQLSQSGLRARSVFNFWRPGYVPPGGPAAQQNLVVPEMQLTNETTVAGYSNYMQWILVHGAGMFGLNGKGSRPDVQFTLTGPVALADDANALVNDTCARLIGDTVDSALKTQMVSAVNSIAVPLLNKGGTNQAAIDRAHQNRAYLAVLLATSSPEFITQR